LDPFVRGSTSGGVSGTGIGLATVHKIVQRLKGNLQIEETPGGGCTVRLEFPS
jgi:signal transduction histidine kinase